MNILYQPLEYLDVAVNRYVDVVVGTSAVEVLAKYRISRSIASFLHTKSLLIFRASSQT